jgi:hypothetical protein
MPTEVSGSRLAAGRLGDGVAAGDAPAELQAASAGTTTTASRRPRAREREP